MDYDIYVDYTRELLSQMKINSYVMYKVILKNVQ